jgi:hypothetical protein
VASLMQLKTSQLTVISSTQDESTIIEKTVELLPFLTEEDVFLSD